MSNSLSFIVKKSSQSGRKFIDTRRLSFIPSFFPATDSRAILSFLQAGCSLVYITSRKASACEAAVSTLNALPNLSPGAKAISVPADISTIEGIQHLVSEVSKTTDHIDILFANAGATWGEKFDTHPDDAFAKVMNLNVKSVFGTVRLYVSDSSLLSPKPLSYNQSANKSPDLHPSSKQARLPQNPPA